MLDIIKIRETRNNEINKKINEILNLIPPNSCVQYKIEKAKIITDGVIDKSSIYTKEKIYYLEDKEKIREFKLDLREDIVCSHAISICIIADNNPVVFMDKKDLVSFVSMLANKEYELWKDFK